MCVCACVRARAHTERPLYSETQTSKHTYCGWTTYDLQMPISEGKRCMNLTEIAGKLNMSLGRAHTGLLKTIWIGEVTVTLGATGTH